MDAFAASRAYEVRLGVHTFPSVMQGSTCQPTSLLDVPIALDDAALLSQALHAVEAEGVPSILPALMTGSDALNAELSSVDPNDPSTALEPHLVLVSASAPEDSCAGAPAQVAISNLIADAWTNGGIRTHVVTYWNGLDPAVADAWAMVGGTSSRVAANDVNELTAALQDVAGPPVPCIFALPDIYDPKWPDRLQVIVDGITYEHNGGAETECGDLGFVVGSDSIELCGSTCRDYRRVREADVCQEFSGE